MDDRMISMMMQKPKYIPVSVGILPSAWILHREKLDAIVKKHPEIFGKHDGQRNYDEVCNATYMQGAHTDVWGCVWENVHHGQEAIVTRHPVPTREDVRSLKAPEKDAGLPHGFMYLRLADLRGFEEVMIDFAEEPPELQMLIDTVLKYNLRQRDIWLSNQKEKGALFGVGDDLGMQHSLAMGPEKWRKYMKPCYMQIYQPVRQAGHYVYMHTDGMIYEIIPDLIECGVNVINPQFRANGLANLVRVCKGKTCVDLDLDRQMFPFCKPSDIDTHVKDVVKALGSPEGGLWLKGEVDDGVPLENIEALCDALEKYRGYYQHSK
jgi:uroporphyrinogen decarboxylase